MSLLRFHILNQKDKSLKHLWQGNWGKNLSCNSVFQVLVKKRGSYSSVLDAFTGKTPQSYPRFSRSVPLGKVFGMAVRCLNVQWTSLIPGQLQLRGQDGTPWTERI